MTLLVIQFLVWYAVYRYVTRPRRPRNWNHFHGRFNGATFRRSWPQSHRCRRWQHNSWARCGTVASKKLPSNWL
jgi:hypothetical protein